VPRARQGRPARRDGFTLIEILVVTLFIGILASIAVVKTAQSKQRAYLAAMKSDLHSIAMSAESRFAIDGTYANVTVPQGSAGVTITLDAGGAYWLATATHAGLPGLICTLGVGGAAELTRPNEPVCQ
jgi:prepilin-type N-terminal cleavage/methylation domain-containing protein